MEMVFCIDLLRMLLFLKISLNEPEIYAAVNVLKERVFESSGKVTVFRRGTFGPKQKNLILRRLGTAA